MTYQEARAPFELSLVYGTVLEFILVLVSGYEYHLDGSGYDIVLQYTRLSIVLSVPLKRKKMQ